MSPSGGGPDVAIRFGPGPYPGYFVSHLSNCELIPVARPGVVEAETFLSADPAKRVRYLMDKRGEIDGTGFCWTEYFSALGKSDNSSENILEFDRADLMLQAGIGGMGIALGRTLLVENDIQERFLEIVGPSVRMRSKYWLVTSPDFAKTDVFSHLLAWLHAEVERSQSIIKTHKSH